MMVFGWGVWFSVLLVVAIEFRVLLLVVGFMFGMSLLLLVVEI